MKPGLYELLLTRGLLEQLELLADPRRYIVAEVDSEESHTAIAQHLECVIASALATFRGKHGAERQTQLVASVINAIAETLHDDSTLRQCIDAPIRRLQALYPKTRSPPVVRPDTPLARSALLTATRLDPSLGSQLAKEIASADRVDILCSFIRWSGLRILIDELKELTDRPSPNGPRLRVITTSYMGATDPKAIETLAALPNTEVRVSYDTQRTRLHAKAYILHRDTGFGSAYVGSANLSHAALSEGLEWTTKVSHYELPYLWSKIVGTFETYWQDDEFTHYDRHASSRFRLAIERERSNSNDTHPGTTFDLRPYPFQEEILDVLIAEREIQRKYRHLVVAATGTGKTMIAAFDYARLCQQTGRRPSLLFIAHREEILRQAMGAFRGVLRDHNFGDLLVGGSEPNQTSHLFASIQSYNSRQLTQLAASHFEYIVVDEFHHAAAPSYHQLLDHANPTILLGLTATPERTDQLDVLEWFGGRTSAEIRLPDAITRRLLCPFQYFGISDSVDLDGVTWQRGGYRIEDLEELYTGNDIRALLILDKVNEILLNPKRARGLGFCVSKAHAEFMARFFSEKGLPSTALTANSSESLRRSAQEQLRSREINFIFVVDLYNEGVDIPEIDTILLLRPTESLTVYLQQLGRGLRQHIEKECLTILDFIGAHRREFRFASRFRSLSTKPETNLEQEVERGFPHLPHGCVVQLERVARQRILENIRQSLNLARPKIVGGLRELGRHLGRRPSLQEAIDYLDIPLETLLKKGPWSRLLGDSKLTDSPSDQDIDQLSKGILRVSHVECAEQIMRWLSLLDRRNNEPQDRRPLEDMLHVGMWGRSGVVKTLADAAERLSNNPASCNDLREVLQHRLTQAFSHPHGQLPHLSGPLTIHASYTRDEAMLGLGHWTFEHRPEFREGVLHIQKRKVDAFFVTLQKTEKDYSPTTMYEDYLISHDQFHWQSQSSTSVDSPTGLRYIHHRQKGYTPLLFVRETMELATGISAPFYYLGPCEYVSHRGSKPISFVWRLRFPVPARLFKTMARHAVA